MEGVLSQTMLSTRPFSGFQRSALPLASASSQSRNDRFSPVPTHELFLQPRADLKQHVRELSIYTI